MIFAWGGGHGDWGPREGNQLTKTRIREHNTCIMVLGTCVIPGTIAICSQERTAPHDTALLNEGQGTAPNYAALHC